MVTKSIAISDNDENKKLKYPKSVAFIISNEFCERFNFYGMRTILVLYLTRRLGYEDDEATVLYHVFTSLAYFFPLIGAIIADSWLGRFKTILYLSIVYTLGSVCIAIGAIPQLYLPATLVTVIGLLFIAFGTGGIKPCVSAFGGDQFKIPEQAKQLATFFSLFYISINAGSLISTTITPILREDVHCFGKQDCFALAFGVPGVLMIISIVIFILGKPFYEMHKPSGNMIVEVSKCIGHAIVKRSKEKTQNPKSHWLDYAEEKFGRQLVDDIKVLLKVLVLYLPLPFFWALQDQQGSRWTFQATRMVGDIGLFTIKPDQMQVLNPILIIVFIPIFDYFIYPSLEKLGLRRSLQKLAFGMCLAGTAFAISGLLELRLESTYPELPNAGKGQLRIFNGMQCNYHFETNIPNHPRFNIEVGNMFIDKHMMINEMKTYEYNATTTAGGCPDIMMGTINVMPGEAIGYFITTTKDEMNGINNNNNSDINTLMTAHLLQYKDNPKKPNKGFPHIRILATTSQIRNINFRNTDDIDLLQTFPSNNHSIKTILAGNYEVFVDDIGVSAIELKLGGSYAIVINEKSNINYIYNSHVLVEPNSIHILWQIPQYVVITAGEIMFSVTGLEFSFTQSPQSMKSVLQASWLLAVAIGNAIVVVIAKVNFFESQAVEFLLFSILMAIDVGVFIILAMRYKYTKVPGHHQDNDDHRSEAIDMPNVNSNNNNNTNDKKINGIDNAAYEI